jgi:ribosomal protein S18 acetylase RimI-like enzyme
MIRATTPADTSELLALTQATGVFKPLEIDTLREVLDDYHAKNAAAGHRCVTLEDDGRILGYAYYAPAAMTDRTWYLYWIAVVKTEQSRGLGRQLLLYVEEDATRLGARVLFIETSSLPHYTPTRRFYEKNNYEVAGVLRDYYSDGDDMVVFRKRLAAAK